MNLIKDLKLFLTYKKFLKLNKVELESKFNIRIDFADRMYTVLNIPTNLVDEPYNIRKSDIDNISKAYIKEYVGTLSEYLNSIGITELYDFYEPIKKVDKYSYLIVIGFKQINSLLIKKFMYTFLILISLSLLLIFIIK